MVDLKGSGALLVHIVDIRKGAGFCALILFVGRRRILDWDRVNGGCRFGREVGAGGCDGGGNVRRRFRFGIRVGRFGEDAAGEGSGAVLGFLGRAQVGINLDFAGLEFAVEIGIDFDEPGVADADDFEGLDGFTGADFFEEGLGEAAFGAVPFGEAGVESGADFAGDEGEDVAERFEVRRMEVKAIDRGDEGFAADAEEAFLHVAEDFADEVVTLETAGRAGSHMTFIVGKAGRLEDGVAWRAPCEEFSTAKTGRAALFSACAAGPFTKRSRRAKPPVAPFTKRSRQAKPPVAPFTKRIRPFLPPAAGFTKRSRQAKPPVAPFTKRTGHFRRGAAGLQNEADRRNRLSHLLQNEPAISATGRAVLQNEADGRNRLSHLLQNEPAISATGRAVLQNEADRRNRLSHLLQNEPAISATGGRFTKRTYTGFAEALGELALSEIHGGVHFAGWRRGRGPVWPCVVVAAVAASIVISGESFTLA